MSIGLFEAVGVELEYMIVRADDLSVLPVADQLLKSAAGKIVSEVDMGALRWSNELPLHVIELKTNGPAPGLAGLAQAFAHDLARMNALLAPLGGRLMPGGAHPLMDPHRETRLWDHEYSPVYQAYDRIFHCRGHGWSNLQSMHLNLPFHGDEEFGRLHAAVRLLLPILPGLAASTPLLDGRVTGFLDSRLEVYRNNSLQVPEVTGLVVPEPVFAQAAYQELILAPMYRAIAPLDPEGVLQEEWLNARGAIARFERDTIEIRLLDSQECPRADLAVAGLVLETAKALAEERFTGIKEQQAWETAPLADLLLEGIRHGERAVVRDPAYLRALGIPGCQPCAVADIWAHLARTLLPPEAQRDPALATILTHGPLARRLLTALGPGPDVEAIRRVYRTLCDCLDGNEPFVV